MGMAARSKFGCGRTAVSSTIKVNASEGLGGVSSIMRRPYRCPWCVDFDFLDPLLHNPDGSKYKHSKGDRVVDALFSLFFPARSALLHAQPTGRRVTCQGERSHTHIILLV